MATRRTHGRAQLQLVAHRGMLTRTEALAHVRIAAEQEVGTKI
ncbi:MAG: hypothetical protein ACRDWD_17785 [Acidimicrobiia bacterium]